MKGIALSKPVIIVGVVGGLAIILLVGLLCGLVGRPNNCVEPTTGSTITPTLPGVSSTTSTTSTSSTTRATLSSASTSTTTSTTQNIPITTVGASNRTVPTITTASTNPPVLTTVNPNELRIPKYIQPTNYNLNMKVFFRPYETSDYFNGTVIIDFKLTEASNRIVLHCDNRLTVLNSVQITKLSGNEVLNVRPNQLSFAANQLYVILLDNVLSIGDYKLKMDYYGDYGPESNIIAFYKTQYVEEGVTK